MSGKRRSSRLAEKREANSLDKETETPKALLNDIVLQNIFKYLGYKDLKSSREVKNTVWLRNSKKAWWSRTKVALTKDKVKEYLNQAELHLCAGNYKLEDFRADDYQGFWEHIGDSIKYLELSNCKFGSVDEFRQVFYTKCPNLEKIEIDVLRINSSTYAVEPKKWEEPQFGVQKNLKFLNMNFSLGAKPLSWMELLSHFPNLEGLEAYAEKDIYKAISIIRQHDPKMLKLKHIDIRGLLNSCDKDWYRPVLLDPNLSFETLRIGHAINRAETLVDILNLHAKSLKSLRISLGTGFNSVQISLRQPLLNLEKMSLNGCHFTADILRHTPNLRKFDLNFGEVRNLLKLADSNLSFKSCKELTIDINEEWKDLPNSNLELLLNVFPNVEILKISGLDNEKFSIICERWTKLVSLKAYSSVVDVCGLLGFAPDSKTKTVRNPNITNLKDLQRFSMLAKIFRKGEMMKAKGRVAMKNADIVLKELETLPRLKKFVLKYYKLENRESWEQLFTEYSGK